MDIKNKYLIAAGIVIILVVMYLVGFKAHFLVADELLLELDPVEEHLTVANGATLPLTFTVATKTHPACQTSCESVLIDESTGKELYDGDTQDTHYFDIPIEKDFAGTTIYRYVVSCTNKKTPLCTSSEDPHKKTSVISVDHSLTPEQQTTFLSLGASIKVEGETLLAALATVDSIDLSNLDDIQIQLEDEKIILQENLRRQQLSLQSSLDSYQNYRRNTFAADVTEYESFIDRLTQIQQTQTIIADILTTDAQTLSRAAAYKNIDVSLLQNVSYEEEYVLLRSLLRDAVNEYEGSYNQTITQLEDKLVRISTQNLSCESRDAVASDIATFNTDLASQRSILFPSLNGSLPSSTNYTDPLTNQTFSIDYYPIETNFSTLDEFCSPTLNFTTITPLTFTVQNATLDLPQQNPQCCIDGNCVACGSEATIPTLFIHGHAFSRAHSPDSSITAFGAMQQQLNSYIDVGQLTQNSQFDAIPAGLWGQFSQPVAVRASYYYVSYNDLGNQVLATQKRDSIENYAIRLKEIIDEVQRRSGSEQINIVAHSMGGLVARQYISLFGEQRVNNLIMIGTPNFGIKGSVDTFCAVTGAQKECEEMKEGSIFLNRLNAFTPQSTKITTIVGTGCDMSGFDGDGVVTSKNVPLDYATNYIINGTCTDFLQTSLHGDLLDPELYPEVLEIVEETLN